ncbi:Protein kinase C-like [Sparassis crispa]|uniref:protein kinase C n=1 Tax=Sparassis crispa TaxID=139825 RepID=A0A401GRN2_9APHY|nr:Protein kinase C-like [Sparassis crispa]GBE84888.1 Protein kinase C-like [Sparassis crispa]
MAHELDQKIQDVYKRIQTERKVLEASHLLRQATTNPDVLRRNDAKIREAERSLSYFEDTLRELQSRKMMQAQRDDHSRSGSPVLSTASGRGGRSSDSPRMHQPTLSDVSSGRGARNPQGSAGSADDIPGVPKAKTYTKLDLIKADTPHTTAKISRMLHQLEFKLLVEKQYKSGIDKMAKLYQADGDKKSRADAESKKVESERKIQLLQSALKRYKNLHILDDAEDDDDDAGGVPGAPGIDGERKDNLRSKNLSGKLQVTLKGARELDHAPIVTGRSRSASKQVETYVSLKVEGTERARSHPTRTDRWLEDFEITIEKANEVEIAVYDKQSNETHPTPIGLLWIKISDLVDAQRRQKVMMENGQGGWVTAGAMNGDGSAISMQAQTGNVGDMNAPIGFGDNRVVPPGSGMPPVGQSEGIDAWFAVEPAGALALHLNFIKENVRKRPLDTPGGLGRQGAVRKRKDEVHEMNGHKFVQRQFYQIILCAFCNEFLLNAVGYQCEDCRYTCHRKCYEKVVTKCISKSNTGEDDAEKINHRIPHRFEPITNIGANWCCHCGYMLPLGRKNARRCTECDITCHANCAHLVPDFCGMSMETANQLLRDWRDINRARGAKSTAQARPIAHYQQPPRPPMPPPEPQVDHIITDVERVKLGEPAVPPKGADYPYGRQQVQSPQETTPPDQRMVQPPLPVTGAYAPPQPRPLPGGRIPLVPAFPSETLQQQVPSGRPGSMLYEDSYAYQKTVQQAVPPKDYAPPPSPGRAIQPERQASLAPSIQQQYRPPAHKRKVGLDDFNFLAVLGKGNFGKVMLAEEKKTSSLYAIKVLKKEFIIDNDEVESTRSEKRVFLAAARERHPFLLGLHSCFQTETRVYFVMEYVSGGDLMLHIQRRQFSLRQAKFYACEVLLALEYFHANGIVYRDLKLDNILLTLDGHVKVADYGLCKEDMYYDKTTSTFCGTPEFMAPEILLEQRYGRAVDWWAFGVLMYEMLLGQSPFRGDDEDEIFDAILEDEPLYPITMPRDAVSILQKLLTRDPKRRLGSTEADAEEIKRHAFFKDVSFDDVVNKRIPPPYFPTVNGTADTSNFDEEFTKEQPTLTPVHAQLSSRDQAEFNGFSWVATWAEI